MRRVVAHVRDLTWTDRLLCGRKDTGQKVLPLEEATERPDLCVKCRQQVWFATMLLQIAAEPPPAGHQYQFGFYEEY